MLSPVEASGYVFFPETGFFEPSPQLIELLGIHQEEADITWSAFLQKLEAVDALRMVKMQEQAISSGMPQSFRHKLRLPQGEWEVLTHSLKWVEAKDDKAAHFVGTLNPLYADRDAIAALLKSEQRFRSLVESQSTFVVRTDLEGAYTFVNQAFLNFFGFEVSDLLGQSYLLTVHPEDEAACKEVGMRCVLEPEKAHNIVLRKPDKEGVFFWSKWEFRAIKDADGGVREVQCMGTDITAQMEIQEELQKQNMLLESIVENILDGVVVCSNEGEFWVFNNSAKKYLGAGAIDTSPEKWQEDYGIFHLDRKTPFEQHALPMSRGLMGESVRDLKLFIRNSSYPNGRYLNSHANPILDEKGVQIGAVGVLHDIDELRRTNDDLEDKVVRRAEELHASEARYRMLAENSQDLISLHALDGTYQYVSASCEDMLGYTQEELIGQDPYQFIHPEDKAHIQKNLHKELLGGREKFGRIEYRFRHKNGAYIWIEVLTQPVMDAQKRPIQLQSTSRDVTHRKQIEEHIQSALNREHELGELKTQLVSMASHQLRTPLSIIRSNLELIRLKDKKRTEHSGNLEKPLERMFRQVDRMTQLVDDVLTLSRIESGQVRLNPEPVLLSDLIKEQIDLQGTEYGTSPKLIQKGQERPVMADHQMFSHAIGNLLGNALKYSQNQDRPPEIALSFREGGIDLTVEDFGIGISASDQHHLFEPFFRGKNALNYQGTGLGLLIARDIIGRHGGAIQVESKLGKGSRFWIFLPASIWETERYETDRN